MGGGDKFLLPLAGRRLIDRCIDRLAPQVAATAISANGDPARLALRDIPVLGDKPPSRGPLSGVLAGLEWTSTLPGVTHMLTVAADTPFFPLDLAERLAGAQTGGVAVARTQERLHPVFALWPTGLRDPLARFLVESRSSRMTDFFDRLDVAEVIFCTTVDQDPFFNVNTPDDFATALKMLEP